ncbi:MAG: mechanosensitive ion channel [Aquabacterium sp.]|uniref:mechanosensitive ion channel family protein n=1 Tax=Aquabacterium sp. TaxID=1872578 RepID=UPI0012118FEC|nr:mechanosensitive ion channel domain-containing protein [Aquabacterium sp.]TAK87405.1 MAG: mechanosensitive ion channel [Aquabacterium sp.]
MSVSSAQVTHPITPDELLQLLDGLQQRSALSEAGIILGCLVLSWGLLRLWRGAQGDAHSVWFGRNIVDGVLFPVLALLLALAARRAFLGILPLTVFRLIIPVLASLAVIRLTVKVLKVAFPSSQTVRVVERTVSWLAWIVTVLWVTGVMPMVLSELEDITWKIGATQVSLRNLIEGSLSAVLVLILSLSLSSAIETKLLKGATDNLSLRKIAANAIRAILLTLGLIMALSAAGIDLTALSVLGGAVGVGLGFGLQKLAANYVSGFVILAERSLRIGDLVKVDNFEGRITDINTRYTVLRSSSGRESIVPNELLITQRVENASLADNKLMLTTIVQVAYGTDLNLVMPRIKDDVAALPRVVKDPGPSVHLSNFAADGLELTIAFWIMDPENGQLGARSAVNLTILETLNSMGVDIPFPQRVVHQARVA